MNRPATADDLDAILDLGQTFHALSPWRDRPFDREVMRGVLERMIESPDAALIWNGHGMIGGVLSPMYFGGGLVAQELFWFAERDGRGLLDAFEAWARERGADCIVMASLAMGEREDSMLDRMYTRRGYALRERHYCKEL